ncbi:sialic acid-binding Ig-like lectin 10 isoform X2 [Notolabrus celidotus]|uniref:sialic acid-binding Ig-like lectin 10 isoform X2 n=1 Tax=Notolabrus celidotus TaxID=1203425 RepID=UPI00148F7F81|nr:sialic acid-binding Ig-like lectin 10 isoform X2 [Notolabrus celidotus]
MFVLIWATLLFSVKDSNADTGASQKRRLCYGGSYCITLIDGEIRAEAGLCVVIPCSFTTNWRFTPQSIDWFKCEPNTRCSDSDVILNSDRGVVQPGFIGRVTLLESDISQRNCSIIIDDLTASDSGSYQLRVNGVSFSNPDRYQYPSKATVSVQDLTQKPTMMIPPLKEGQQTTLSCTAPGLCSGSVPEITWMWRGGGVNDTHITGNISAVKTENLRHSSTSTFTPSAEHHGTDITCKVSFTGGMTTEETVTLNVTYVKEVKVSGNTRVREGETLNLTCNIESFPPSLITWTKLSDKNMQRGTETNLQNNASTIQENQTATCLQEGVGEVTLSISNVTAKDSGLYVCTAKHLNNTLMEEADVKVIYMKTPVITGNVSLNRGDALNLTCSVESFPLSHITWTLPRSDTDLQNDTGSSTLIISNVKAENSGRYICTAKHLNSTVTVFSDVSVTWFPSIFKNSGCEIQSRVLTCVCLSEGFPLPTIKWPLLKNHTQYSVITAVTNHIVNSTLTLTVQDHSNTSAECVSSNENGEVKESLTILINMPEKQDQSWGSKIFSWLEVLLAFLLGVLLTAVLCLLAKKCHRQRQMTSGNLNKTLEMVTSQEDPLIDAGQEAEDDHTYDQEVTEGGEAVAEEKTTSDPDVGPKDVEYASIDFTVLKRKTVKKQETTETTETEYAEIKKEGKEQRENHDGINGEMMQGKEEEVLIGEEEETKIHALEEEDDATVYSTVKDVLDEI